MIDLKFLRENPELVRANAARRNCPINFDTLISLESLCRELTTEVEEIRARRNRLSKECKDNPEARDQVRLLRDELGRKEAVLAKQTEKLTEMLSFLPNMLAPDVPDGTDDMDNVELRKVGTIPTFSFKVRDHQELGEMLDILDTARGAKVAQSGFYYWKGKGAILAQALFYWVQRTLVERGFTLFMTPCVAKERTLYGTGYIVSGIIWGLWHVPLTIIGHNYGTGYKFFPFAGIAAMCLFCTVVGTFLSYLSLKTQSCIPAVLGHAGINSISTVGMYFTKDGGNPFLGPVPSGIIGMIPFIFVVILICIDTKKNVTN